ncbi:MAG: hypothetical protein KF814_15640 [Nitrospiraceae bacterium]|nr:hypothetical protein [Nitrospiraceae bacterium]
MSTSADLSHVPTSENNLIEDADGPSGGEPASEVQSLDKIRDILFGAQVRDHERRFARLETQLLAEAAQLRTDLKQRFTALEQYIRNEVDGLTARLQSEQQSRTSSIHQVSADLQNLAEALRVSAASLQERGEQADSQIRQELQAEANALKESFVQRHTELSATMESAVERLSAQKTDRASLAALFQELSIKLSDDRRAAQR